MDDCALYFVVVCWVSMDQGLELSRDYLSFFFLFVVEQVAGKAMNIFEFFLFIFVFFIFFKKIAI